MTIQFLKTEVQPHGMAPAEESHALQLIEGCGRTAYKSEDKITPDSARSFVLMLKKHGHLSVLEHSNIVLKVDRAPSTRSRQSSPSLDEFYDSLIQRLAFRNAFHRLYPLDGAAEAGFIMAGNLRSWIETLAHLKGIDPIYFAFFLHHLKQFFPIIFAADVSPGHDLPFAVSLVGPDEQLALQKKDPACDLPVFVFKFICDRGITHEVVRHRVFSFTQESTRYVNYGNRGMALILPEELYPFYDDGTKTFIGKSPLVDMWVKRAELFFSWYKEDLERSKPEIARDILPNLLKSEIFVTGRWSGWDHFIQLREPMQAHPRIRSIARDVRTYFDSIGLTRGVAQ